MTTGCPIIIADGLKGNDDVAVPVAGGEYVKRGEDRPRRHGRRRVHLA